MIQAATTGQGRDRSGVGSALADVEGWLRDVDDDFCALLALPRERLLAMRLSDLFAEDVLPWPPAGDGGAFHFDATHLRCDADRSPWMETAWLRVVGKRLGASAGASGTYVVMIEDMSPRKGHHQAMLELQQRYATIIDASHRPMAILLPDGTLADCNQAALDIHGVAKPNLVGSMTWPDLWFGGDPKLAARLKFAVEQARHGKTTRAVLAVVGPDGRTRDLDYEVKPIFGPGGSLTYLFIEASDVTDLRRATARLYESVVAGLNLRVQLLEQGVAAAADHIVWLDAEGRLIEANDSTIAKLGYGSEQLLGMTLADIAEDCPPEDYAELIAAVQRDGWARREVNLRRLDGSHYPVDLILTALAGDGPPPMCGILRDITDRKEAEDRLRKLSMAVEQSPMVVIITDRGGRIEYVNQRFCEVSGYRREEVLGHLPNFLRAGAGTADGDEDPRSAVFGGRIWRGELCNTKRNGEPYWEYAVVSPVQNDRGEISHYLAVKEDITLRKEYEERLLRHAHYDQLTGLPNRFLTMDRLEQAVALAARAKSVVVVMVVNLDRLKKVNDTVGHEGGDQVMVQCAERLTAVVRDCDTVARLDGDEFLVILGGLNSPAAAENTARRVLEECRKPYHVGEQEVFLTARMGLAAFPNDGEGPAALIRKAHAAAARAGEHGGNTFCFFTPQIDNESQARLRIESRLRRAIENNELRVFYQPLVDAFTSRIVGAEALLRWTNPELGAVPPDVFIPIAEASDFITPLSDWALDMACRDAAVWRQAAGEGFRLAVNFSPRQFDQKDLVEKLLCVLDGAGFPPRSLEVEVTERLLLNDGPRVRRLLGDLKDVGVSLSVDDFGTGYSALTYLKRYAFDTLKIDRSFVSDLESSRDGRFLVAAIVDMAHALHMQVVAEGVESDAHKAILQAIGCEVLQGYLFGRPMPAADFSRLLRSSGGQRVPAVTEGRLVAKTGTS